MGMNIKLLISTVDPLAAGALPDAVVAVDAGELTPPPFELEPHAVATADTAIMTTKTKSARRGRSEAARARAPIVRIMVYPLSQTATQEKSHAATTSQLHCWAFPP
jgi:hypothetical protein